MRFRSMRSRERAGVPRVVRWMQSRLFVYCYHRPPGLPPGLMAVVIHLQVFTLLHVAMHDNNGSHRETMMRFREQALEHMPCGH